MIKKDAPVFFFNHFIYLDHKQLMKISHKKLQQNVIKPIENMVVATVTVVWRLIKERPLVVW